MAAPPMAAPAFSSQLLLFFFITYFFACYVIKYVYSGTATIYSIVAGHCDSLEATVLLRFESKRPGIIGGQPIYIQSANPVAWLWARGCAKKMGLMAVVSGFICKFVNWIIGN